MFRDQIAPVAVCINQEIWWHKKTLIQLTVKLYMSTAVQLAMS